jgi:hypothetical protein
MTKIPLFTMVSAALLASAPLAAQPATTTSDIVARLAGLPAWLADLEAIVGPLERDRAKWEEAVGPVHRERASGPIAHLDGYEVDLLVDRDLLQSIPAKRPATAAWKPRSWQIRGLWLRHRTTP